MRPDLWRFLGVAVVSGIIGALIDQFFLALWIGTLGHCVWHYRRLVQLRFWIPHRKRHPAPDSPGLFEDICRAVDVLGDREKKRKKKLSGYLKQFRHATTALADAAVVLGTNDQIEWANPAAENLLGIQWPQDWRQRITNLVRDPKFTALLNENHDTGSSRTAELPSPLNAERILSISSVPFGADQRLLTARDITRLHRLDQVRRDFVANVSHELRTPVTVIRGYLEILVGDPDRCPEAWRPILAQLETQTLRMQSIIEDLLLLSRLGQSDKITDARPVQVPELIGTIYQEAQALAGKPRHMFSLEIDPALSILGAKNELHSAFSNLVVNAIRYTPEGGVIRVRWYKDASGAHFEVSDTGIGIPPQHLPRLTERFYRVDQGRSRESGGSGLGLAIVNHVLKRHQARLHIASTVGEGSTFRCDFPGDLITPPHAETAIESLKSN